MIVSEFRQGQFVRLTPNQYFRAGRPATDGVVMLLFQAADPVAHD
ncbi:hypothetical protein [Mesorhizobium sp. M0571]